MKIMIRWMTLLMMGCLALLFATILFSTLIPNRLGALVISGMYTPDAETQRIYIDIDTRIRAIEHTESEGYLDLSIRGLRFMLFSSYEDANSVYYYITESGGNELNLLRYDSSGSHFIRRYFDIEAIDLLWHIRNEKLLLIEADEEAGLILHSIDVVTGDISPIMTFPDYQSASVRQSPDGRYSLLRAIPASGNVIRNQTFLLDTETGTFTELDDLVFAYWSPVNYKIAIAYESDVPSELDVGIYDVESNTRQALGFRISEQDALLYYDGFAATGVLWSDDAQALAIVNRSDGQLYASSVSGEVQSVAGDRLIPKQWSPDHRYLLVIGRNEAGDSGAFIINFENGVVAALQSESPVVDLSIEVSWSPDSRYLALMDYSSAQSRVVALNIFDTQGHLIRDMDTLLPFNFQLYFATMQWSNED